MEKKMNNKGFSLVELIIVIAIMVVLGVVVALALTKYPEQARNATDVQNATSICTALQIYAVDPDATTTPAATGTVNVGSNTSGDAFANAALANAGFPTTTKCESTSTWTAYSITYNYTGGVMTFTYGQTGGTAGAFSAKMTGATE